MVGCGMVGSRERDGTPGSAVLLAPSPAARKPLPIAPGEGEGAANASRYGLTPTFAPMARQASTALSRSAVTESMGVVIPASR